MKGADAQPSLGLDALRAGAALLVLLSHARDMLVRDAAATPAMGFAARAVMAVAGLGHEAVIVFFVLSGTLVTGSMLRLAAAGRWSLAGFAAARLTRLWVVLIPCVALGGGLDALGLALRGPAMAGVAYGIPPLSGAAPAPVLTPVAALGNLLFFQTVLVPVFGSNGALWSLANEAWYYALAGLAFAAWHRRRSPLPAALLLTAATGLLALLPGAILQLAPVWGFGAALALLRPARSPRLRQSILPGLAVAAVLLASRLRLGNGLTLDLLLGIATALLIRPLAAMPSRVDGRAVAAVRRLSGLSYSLYLSHCPVLALFAAVTIGAHRQPIGLGACGLMVAAMALALAVAWAVWWAFERHTPIVRATVMRFLAQRRTASALAVQGTAA